MAFDPRAAVLTTGCLEGKFCQTRRDAINQPSQFSVEWDYYLLLCQISPTALSPTSLAPAPTIVASTPSGLMLSGL